MSRKKKQQRGLMVATQEHTYKLKMLDGQRKNASEREEY